MKRHEAMCIVNCAFAEIHNNLVNPLNKIKNNVLQLWHEINTNFYWSQYTSGRQLLWYT